jgi:Family of unknown function (DUF5683)
MTRQCTFLLMIWLLCTHFTAALAVTPRPKRVRNHAPAQSRRKVIALPRRASQVAGNAASNTARQPSTTATAQDDAIKKRRYVAEEMVMQRAWIYSAIFPGWGQVYNDHYWKVPVIYAGFAGFFGGAIYYHREYLQSTRSLIQEKNKNAGNKNAGLENYVNECRSDRDLCFILAALWYVVNIFDAYVGASLKTFTLSDDVSMKMEPAILPTTRNFPAVGLSLTLSFRNENTTDRLWKNGAGY